MTLLLFIENFFVHLKQVVSPLQRLSIPNVQNSAPEKSVKSPIFYLFRPNFIDPRDSKSKIVSLIKRINSECPYQAPLHFDLS